ncbi:MAG TPA: hypothetical protein VI341_12010 [Actinomycetota bacterium]
MRSTARTFTAFVLALGLVASIPPAGVAAADPVFDWWGPAAVDPPPNQNVVLSDVDALGPSDAWAVGSREVAADDFETFVMHWGGSSWDPVNASPVQADELSAVLARSSNDVFVGGSIDDTQPVFGHFDGSEWTDLPTPPDVLGMDRLEAVGDSEIWGVAPHGEDRLIYRWDGSAWSEVPLPIFPDQDLTDIADIQARSATEVWVTGTYHDAVAQVSKAISIRWDGSAWIDMAPPAGLTSMGEITVVGPTNAFAEARENVGGLTETSIQHWDGSSWSSMLLPLDGDIEVEGLEATSADDIWAVGEFDDGSRRSFMAHSDGSTWTAWEPVDSRSSLHGLSFPSSAVGFAVGEIGTNPGIEISSYVLGPKIDAGTTPSQVDFGQPTTVHGTLSFKDEQDASGVTIHVERFDRNDVATTLSDVTTGSGGSFSFADMPTTVGTNTYRFVSELDGAHIAGVGSASVDVGRRTSSIELTASPRSISYGRTTRITAQLEEFEPDSTIEIWALKPGGGRELQRRKAVGGDGALSVTVKPKATTSYVANSLRDDTFEVARTVQPIVVGVRPIVEASMHDAYGTGQGYRLYHYSSRCPSKGVRCPRFVGRVSPEHSKCFVVRFQQHTRTGWSTIHDGCFKPDPSSRVILNIVYGDRRVIGQRFRLRTEFSGDKDHEPADSSWAYFRVTD